MKVDFPHGPKIQTPSKEVPKPQEMQIGVGPSNPQQHFVNSLISDHFDPAKSPVISSKLIKNWRVRSKALRREASRLTERADLLKFCAQEVELIIRMAQIKK